MPGVPRTGGVDTEGDTEGGEELGQLGQWSARGVWDSSRFHALTTNLTNQSSVNKVVLLTFRKWRRRFPGIFCGWLVRGVGAGPLGPSHLAPEASLPRRASWRGVWKPGPSVPVTPVNSSTRRAPCLNAPGSRPGHAMSLRRPHSRHCRQLSPLTTRLPKNPLPPASFCNVAPFGKRSDRTDPPRFYISKILCL